MRFAAEAEARAAACRSAITSSSSILATSSCREPAWGSGTSTRYPPSCRARSESAAHGRAPRRARPCRRAGAACFARRSRPVTSSSWSGAVSTGSGAKSSSTSASRSSWRRPQSRKKSSSAAASGREPVHHDGVAGQLEESQIRVGAQRLVDHHSFGGHAPGGHWCVDRSRSLAACGASGRGGSRRPGTPRIPGGAPEPGSGPGVSPRWRGPAEPGAAGETPRAPPREGSIVAAPNPSARSRRRRSRSRPPGHGPRRRAGW